MVYAAERAVRPTGAGRIALGLRRPRRSVGPQVEDRERRRARRPRPPQLLADGALHVAERERRARLAVVQDRREPRDRVARIERNVGAARLQDGKEAHDRLGTNRSMHSRHRRLGADPEPPEAMSQLIRPPVELAEGETLGAADDGHRVGRRDACASNSWWMQPSRG